MINNWEKVTVPPDAKVKDALIIIDSGALRVALVVDSNNDLLGTVTDGDIRRGLLKGVGLNDEVQAVMMSTPVTAAFGTAKGKLIEIMNELDILFIPLVEQKKLVGLETLHSALMARTQYNNPVFIMAGGFGKRLRPLTDNCPKPMLDVGGRPMLETIILQFKKYGFSKFYLSTHYLPHVISDHFGDGSKLGVSIEYVYEDKPLGTGGALGLLPENTPKLPLLMINGDVLTGINYSKLLEFHELGGASATMCVREYEYQVPYGVIEGAGEKVESMVEKPIQRFYINAGVYVLDPQVFTQVQSGTKIDMPALLESEIEKGSLVHKYPVHEYWLDIGQKQDFERAQIEIKSMGLV
ncbi:nucleotidyltransferase family protein [Oceaniserpentilla sp. 4NH20-0058]|uniref:nucleotidyltransferase family protein n=1 Tax=Oceaniserpentilla sp. 4NH20-0058 TaxID=3127660 RepID=UPI00310289F8